MLAGTSSITYLSGLMSGMLSLVKPVVVCLFEPFGLNDLFPTFLEGYRDTF